VFGNAKVMGKDIIMAVKNKWVVHYVKVIY
jgi:hypothetical protein